MTGARESSWSERRTMLALLGITAAAAALRFLLLGHQGLWYDESLTAREVRLPIPALLWVVRHEEVTPPLYFVAGRVWTHLFGASVFALRSLSALAGTLVAPLGYLAVRWLVSRRAALIAAALIAVNPLLVWYSQEARAYSMLVLWTAAALAALAGARRFGDWRFVPAWGLACILGVATHFFAGFVILPMAVWMLLRGPRPASWLGVAAVAAAQAALVPLALSRRGHGIAWIGHIGLDHRLQQLPEHFLIGYGSVAGKALLALEGGVVLLALVCVVWGTSGEERAGLRLAGAIGLVSLALPLLLIGAGQDYFLTRNVIGALVPLLAVVAGGLGAARVGALGVVLAAVLCAGGGMAIASVDSKASLERPDWGGLARALGPAREERAVVVSGAYQAVSLGLYLDRSTLLPGHARPVRVREIDLVGTRPPPRSGCWWGAVCNLPRAIPRRRPPARGFRLAGERRLATFTVLRFRSRRATLLTNARRELHSPLLFRTRRKHRWVVFAQRPSPALSVR